MNENHYSNNTNWLERIANTQQIQQILELNGKIQQFGLVLNEEDIRTLMTDRKDSLKEQQRVEFGEGILAKLLISFCDSPYIDQENLVDIMGRLQEIFYEYKNESLDELSDDELIAFMREKFDKECQGSVDFLEETVLEAFARMIREYGQNQLEYYKDMEKYDEFEEEDGFM